MHARLVWHALAGEVEVITQSGPGKHRLVPYTNSAAEQPMSSLRAVLIPSKAKGVHQSTVLDEGMT